jgi:multidrug resistance efflux pump
MYVQPGAKLYSVADLSTVWVYAQVFRNDIGRVKVGDPASVAVNAYPDQTCLTRAEFA